MQMGLSVHSSDTRQHFKQCRGASAYADTSASSKTLTHLEQGTDDQDPIFCIKQKVGSTSTEPYCITAAAISAAQTRHIPADLHLANSWRPTMQLVEGSRFESGAGVKALGDLLQQ